MEMKRLCLTCRIEKNISDFYSEPKNFCKECIKASRKKNYQENKELITERQKTYYEAHRVELLEYKKSWYQDNREKYLEMGKIRYQEKRDEIREYLRDYYLGHHDALKSKARNYYRENKEKIIAHQCEYAKINPDKVALYKSKYKANHRLEQYISDNKRHQLKLKSGTIIAAEWKDLLEKYEHKCLVCGSTENPSMDHIIPLSKGGRHSIDNVQPLCVSCNSHKGTKTIDYRVDNFEYT